MRPEHVKYLRCPSTGAALRLDAEETVNGRVRTGRLISKADGSINEYPVIEYIPRFVTSENYATNFGFEWNLHARTQCDEVSGHKMTEDRFFAFTGWPSNLEGQVVLEAGSGSGRFTEQLLGTGATVISFDFSNAVDANYQSNGTHPNLLLVQGDMYHMPFARDEFDRVLCYGVLQHTPDPEKSFQALVPVLKPGGHLATDIYLKSIKFWLLNTRYLVRPFTRNIPSERLYWQCKRYIDFMWPLVRLLRKLPLGQAIIWRLLIADYSTKMPNANDQTLKEWAYLDTFDMLSPRYDEPQTPRTFRTWHEKANLTDINIALGSNGVAGTARKPITVDHT